MIYLLRFSDFIQTFSVRLNRLLVHVRNGVVSVLQKPFSLSKSGFWWLKLIFLTLDIIGAGEIYESFSHAFKWNTRRLTPEELKAGISVFGNSIHWKRVRIDEKAFIGCKQGHFCYVSFYTINSWGPFSLALLIHELMHIWQYEHHGSAYIPEAWKAMRSKQGYNYGGVEGLKKAKTDGRHLFDFNFEQQADILADSYVALHTLNQTRNKINAEDSGVLGYFANLARETPTRKFWSDLG